MRLHRQDDFWRAHLRPPAPPVAPSARSFLNRLLSVDPARRASPAEALFDPWLTPGHAPAEAREDAVFAARHLGAVASRAAAQEANAVAAAVACAAACAAAQEADAQEVVFSACVVRSAGSLEALALSEEAEDEEEEEDRGGQSWEFGAAASAVTSKPALVVGSCRDPAALVACAHAGLLTAGATITMHTALVLRASFPAEASGYEAFGADLPLPPGNDSASVAAADLELVLRVRPCERRGGGEAVAGVWVVDAARCGKGDGWRLSQAWRCVLVALANAAPGGCPEAKAALDAAADAAAASPAIPGVWLAAPRLPPPSDDDPEFNGLLRSPPPAAESGASAAAEPFKVLANADDEVF
jgi:hypothetical protein